MKHHLIKEDCIHCLYCNQDLSKDEWKSTWDKEHHYKNIQCSCGRSNRIKVEFHGSGHDDWQSWAFKDDLLEQVKEKIGDVKIVEKVDKGQPIEKRIENEQKKAA